METIWYTLFGFLNATKEQWLLAAGIGGVLYALVLAYLFKKDEHGHAHATYEATAPEGAGCIDYREDVKYRIPGGVGTFALGIPPWLLLQYLGTGDWLADLARIQFLLAVFDIAILYKQFIAQAGPEKVKLRSHSFRKLGCGRTSAHDPVGLTLYLIQILTGWKWLAFPRAVIQFFVYDLIGTPMCFIVTLPARLFGKKVTPIPV